MKRRALVLVAVLLLAPGCAALAPQQVGQMVGTVAGSAIVPGLGAPIGGLLGLLAGMVVQKRVDQVTEQHERIELGQQLNRIGPSEGAPTAERDAPPFGTPTRVWVDETWREGRLVAGSFEERYLP